MADTGKDLYDRLLSVFAGYVAPANAKATLDLTLSKRGTPGALRAADLESVVAKAMIGLRLYCAPDRVGDLMLDLAEFCERETPPQADDEV